MNTSNVKSTAKQVAKRTGLFAVDYIAAPLHMGLQIVSNVVQVAADGVAMGEGYLTEKIDPTQDRVEVATSRVDHTKMRFMQTAAMLQTTKDKLQRSIDTANVKIDNIKQSFNKEAEEIEVVEPEHVGHVPPAGYSRVLAIK